MNAISQLNDTILEVLNGLQIQGNMAVTPSDQWNTFANDHWGHADDEFINRVLVKKGGDQLPAPFLVGEEVSGDW